MFELQTTPELIPELLLVQAEAGTDTPLADSTFLHENSEQVTGAGSGLHGDTATSEEVHNDKVGLTTQKKVEEVDKGLVVDLSVYELKVNMDEPAPTPNLAAYGLQVSKDAKPPNLAAYGLTVPGDIDQK